MLRMRITSVPLELSITALIGHHSPSTLYGCIALGDETARTAQCAVQTQPLSPIHEKFVVVWKLLVANAVRQRAVQLWHVVSIGPQYDAFDDEKNVLSCRALGRLSLVPLRAAYAVSKYDRE